MLEIEPIPAFRDNYIWLVHDGKQAAVVDPGDAEPVQRILAERGIELCAVLVTHHHPDHVGGIGELVAGHKLPVYGPAHDGVESATYELNEGDEVIIEALELRLRVLDIPGHTAGHIAFVADAEHALFCGDTLFSAGCGRLFEGTAAQMLASLDKLAALPDNTRVYCGHEYTVRNLEFARELEPGHPAVNDRLAWAQAQRARQEPTLPSTLDWERRINPFLRVREAGICDAAARRLGRAPADEVEVFAAIRDWKDEF